MDTTMKMAVFLFVLTLGIVGFMLWYGQLFYGPGPESGTITEEPSGR